ncbi:hypothetical protein VNI00_011579 [Paramarasmius palmivorus]|uniref:Protein kinase domain-containing protein n=1 Tax=Paramarasmius palmivorus TaxID=297713 RepID=A0AAW0CFZ9_9AGAR
MSFRSNEDDPLRTPVRNRTGGPPTRDPDFPPPSPPSPQRPLWDHAERDDAVHQQFRELFRQTAEGKARSQEERPLSHDPSSAYSSDGSWQTSVSNTPYNPGAADHYAYEYKPTRNDYDPYLKFDVANQKTVELDPYLSTVLHLDDILESDIQALTHIAESDEFHRLLAAYCVDVNDEIKRYPPFVELFNFVVREMVKAGLTGNEQDLVLCISHPVPIRGSRSERKPDTVIVKALAISFRLAERQARKEAAAKAKGEQGKAGPKKARVRKPKLAKDAEGKVAAEPEDTKDVKDVEVKDGGKKGKGKGKDADAVLETAKKPPSGSSRSAYMWDDILTFIEFKMSKHSIKLTPDEPQSEQSSSTSRKKTQKKGKGKLPTPTSTEPSGSGPSFSFETSSGNVTSGSKRPLDLFDSDFVEPSAKRSKGEGLEVHRLQCASYALEMFNRGGIRTHVIGSLIDDDKMYLLLYTRSGSCHTVHFSFVHEPLTFLRVVLAFTRLSFSDWGYCDQLLPQRLIEPSLALQPRVPDPAIFKGRTFKLGELEFVIETVLVFPRGLISRGTWILLVKCLTWGGKEVVVKISSPAVKRTAEWTFGERATDFAKKDPETHGWVLKHLPEIYAHGVIESASFGSLFGDDFEEREVRYLVMERLYSITELTDPMEFLKVFKDTVLCHQWLVLYPQIMHRDISVNNLMFRREDGKVYGVLNDLDLAVFIEERAEPSSKHRTGTKPFIALDLLNPKNAYPNDDKHYARYDLESFVYVFGWVLGRFKDGKQIENPPYNEWGEGTWGNIEANKQNWLSRARSREVTSTYQPLIGVLDNLCARLKRGLTASEDAYIDSGRRPERMKGSNGQPFDHVTLDGHVTYTKFLEALKLPDPESD